MTNTQTAIINIRVDKATKARASKVIEKIGLDVSSAIKLFLNKVIQTGSIPFHIGAMNDPLYIAQIKKEVEWAKKYGKRYSTPEELFADLDRLNA